MAWDDVKAPGNIIPSADYNIMVTYIKSLLGLGGGTLTGALVFAGSTFTDEDATPAVDGGNVFDTANTATTVITQFDGGTARQVIFIMFNDDYTAVAHNSNIKLSGGVQLDFLQYETLCLIKIGSVWVELR